MSVRSAACLLATFACEPCFGIRVGEVSEELADAVSAMTAGMEVSAQQEFRAGFEAAQQAESDADFEALGLEASTGKAVKNFKKAVTKGKAAEAKLTCEQIQEEMPYVIGNLTEEFYSACNDEDCDFDTISVEEAIMAQQGVVGFAAAVDKRKCLPEVMGSQAVQERITEYLSFVTKVLHNAPSMAGRSRVQQAYLQLVAFQQGVPELAVGLADRKLLLDVKNVCPSVCRMCDQQGSGAFGFRCLVYSRDKNTVPVLKSGHDLECAAPEKRGWLRRYRYGRQCTVPDWKESAMQHVHVAAAVSCTGETILMSVNSELTTVRRREMYALCLATEQGNDVTSDQKKEYEDQGKLMDGVVPRNLNLALNSILTVGLASGLASLRQATRGHARSALLERDTVDFAAPFEQQLGIEGLQVPAEDVTMYGKHSNRAETLARLEACEDVYSMKAESTFVEGAKALSMHSLALRQQAEAEKAVVKISNNGGGSFQPLPVPAPSGGYPGYPGSGPPAAHLGFSYFLFTFLLGGILSFLYVYAISIIALYLCLFAAIAGAPLLFFLIGSAWMFLLVAGTVSIWRFAGMLVGTMVSGRSAKKVEQCMQSA